MAYKFIDLFAGIGGFHVALHNLGAECVFASEWDEPARKTSLISTPTSGGANKFWINCYLNPDGDFSIVAGDNRKVVAAGAWLVASPIISQQHCRFLETSFWLLPFCSHFGLSNTFQQTLWV